MKKILILSGLVAMQSLCAQEINPEIQTFMGKNYVPMSDEYFKDFQKVREIQCIETTKGSPDEQKRAALCPCISEYETMKTKENPAYLTLMQKKGLTDADIVIIKRQIAEYFMNGITKCAIESGYHKK